MSALYTMTFPAIIGADLLPLGYSFGVVVCLEGGLSSRLWLVDNTTISVAEDLRTCCNEE